MGRPLSRRHKLPDAPFDLLIAQHRELEPVRGTSFNVKSLPGSSLSFKRDAAGKVSEAAFVQPGSTIVLKRQ